MVEKLIRKMNGLQSDEPLSKGLRFLKELIEWIMVIVIAIAIAFVIRKYLFTMVKVDGSSMDNTLAHGDNLVVWSLNYTPEEGDIIVFNPYGDDERPYIKRVIATEGQSIYVDANDYSVYVDGEKISEDYIGSPTTTGIAFPVGEDGLPTNNPDEIFSTVIPTKDAPYVVPDDHVFAMGDNRAHSHDCRGIGPVHKDDIIGEAVLRWYPFNKFGTL